MARDDMTDLEFRDRVVEFIGRTTSSLDTISKDSDCLREVIDANTRIFSERFSKLEERLHKIEQDYLITKTKIALWTGLIVVLLQIAMWAFQPLLKLLY